MSDDLARLLVVQDLDTTITQLEHRRATLVESSGLAAVERQLDLARLPESDRNRRFSAPIRSAGGAPAPKIRRRTTGRLQRTFPGLRPSSAHACGPKRSFHRP